MALTSAEASALSQWFRDLSIELGNYRAKEWNNLSDNQRQSFEEAEWRLLNAANELTTAAVGLALDESEASFAKLRESTDQAKTAIKTLQTVGKVINVAAAAVSLAAAIASKNVGAIGKNTKSLYEAATADVA